MPNHLNINSPNALVQMDEFGRIKIGGPIGLADIKREFASDPYVRAGGELALDVAPGTGEYRDITQHLPAAYQAYNEAQTPIQKVLRAGELGAEGLGTAAGLMPGVKLAGATLLPLVSLMARRNDELSGMARYGRFTNQRGMIGYHGSPHKFTRFDHSKMGTGEGAQAYGWGTYLAESPDVAKSYIPRDFDAEDVMMSRYNQAINSDDMTRAEVWERAMMHDTADEISDFFKDPDVAPYHNPQSVESAIDEVRALEREMAGNLYKVDLPDEKIAQMLDWDAPLSEQPANIQEIAKQLDPNLSNMEMHWVPNNGGEPQHWTELADSLDDLPIVERVLNKGDEYFRGQWVPYGEYMMSKQTGGEFYREIASGGEWGKQARNLNRGDVFGREASERLNQLGIPGIKYYDGNSRAAGKGTRNFVVFDENDMTILTRNGEQIK